MFSSQQPVEAFTCIYLYIHLAAPIECPHMLLIDTAVAHFGKQIALVVIYSALTICNKVETGEMRLIDGVRFLFQKREDEPQDEC